MPRPRQEFCKRGHSLSSAHITRTKSGYIKRTCRKCRYIRYLNFLRSTWNIYSRRSLFAALLITTWPDGTIQKSPAIDEKICQIAAAYDLSRGAKSAYCISNLDPIAAGFPPDWDCIKGFNCK